jgi:lipopolysaccharide transport system permease protein
MWATLTQPLRSLYDYRELLVVLTWKNISLRYKQSHLGIAWMVLKPLVLVAVFSVVRSFVGIDSGEVPYALLTYCAMVPWTFFQESTSDGVGSVVNNGGLIKKIYFPRELFPVVSLLTKVVDLGVSLSILTVLMGWYGVVPHWTLVWAPLIIGYTIAASLAVSLAGAAMNVYSRDLSQALPLLLSLLMYLSPVMYPLQLVKIKLVDQQMAGTWSDTLYLLYTLNPMAGAIDGFQRVVLRGLSPDWSVMWPGMLGVAVLLPLSYLFFKQAEAHFADVI